MAQACNGDWRETAKRLGVTWQWVREVLADVRKEAKP